GAAIIAETVQHELKWLATARARLGWANDGYLLYVTGGGAPGRPAKTEKYRGYRLRPNPTPRNKQRRGWWLAGGREGRGGGGGGWTAKLEYLHIDLGHISTTLPVFDKANDFNVITTISSIRDDIIRVGLNYKFGYTAAPAVYK